MQIEWGAGAGSIGAQHAVGMLQALASLILMPVHVHDVKDAHCADSACAQLMFLPIALLISDIDVF